MHPRPCGWKLLVGLLLTIGGVGCSEEVAGPRAWIDVPLNGSSIPAGARVAVISHAFARDGVAEVLLTVNGQAYRRSAPKPGDTFSQTSLEWTPTQAGEYVLEVTAFSKKGRASNPARVSVRAMGKSTATPVPIISVTPPRDRTITLVGAPDLAIVNVEAIFVAYKGTTAICNTRVTYRNAGTVAVPRNFAIQFDFDGVPTLTNTVAGGLPPGASAQIIFVHQFEGSPYIGINLDSTNVIAESSERNNAFAEARLCSGPTPVPPISVTPTTPTLTPTPRIVTPPPSTGCSGSPNISSFTVSPSSLQRGQSATLSWGAVSNADSVSVQPDLGGVGTPGSTTVSPGQTTTYTLTASCGKNQATRQVTINVSTPVPPTYTPTRTRTPTPRDTQGPPAPNLVSPKGSLQCTTNVTLDWKPVSDPSGIKQYIVKWVRNDGPSGGTVTNGTAHGISVTCGKSYTWSVQAVDNAGNAGDKSSASFSIQLGLY